MKRLRSRMISMFLGEKEVWLQRSINSRFLHSNQLLKELTYPWMGEIHPNEVRSDDRLITIDTYKYRARHQYHGSEVVLGTGSYVFYNSRRPLKLSGVIRDNKLYVLITKANSRVSDIATMAPLRVSGLPDLHIKMKRFSSYKSRNTAA